MSAWWIPWAAVVVAVIWLQVRRALQECDRIITDAQVRTETVHDVGPDSLRLLENTDAHITEYVAEDPDLWEAFGPGAPVPDLTTHPDFAAGFDRLRQAIRDEQQNGDA
ncbi:hypothetical protein ACFXKC_28335 [Streptomyces sp. NPDC059340]|uniref:hypothetical protein n=1 Tax=Streptomyces sp. NPDC059340 TaxID=3346806 RepID=UPI0036B19457